MWFCLRRLKEEGKEGVEFGQYLYEIYNHDLELRVSKAGVSGFFYLQIFHRCMLEKFNFCAIFVEMTVTFLKLCFDQCFCIPPLFPDN